VLAAGSRGRKKGSRVLRRRNLMSRTGVEKGGGGKRAIRKKEKARSRPTTSRVKRMGNLELSKKERKAADPLRSGLGGEGRFQGPGSEQVGSKKESGKKASLGILRKAAGRSSPLKQQKFWTSAPGAVKGQKSKGLRKPNGESPGGKRRSKKTPGGRRQGSCEKR